MQKVKVTTTILEKTKDELKVISLKTGLSYGEIIDDLVNRRKHIADALSDVSDQIKTLNTNNEKLQDSIESVRDDVDSVLDDMRELHSFNFGKNKLYLYYLTCLNRITYLLLKMNPGFSSDINRITEKSVDESKSIFKKYGVRIET